MNIDRTISFRQDMIDLIRQGRKTLTIRPVKDRMRGFMHKGKTFYTLKDDCFLHTRSEMNENCLYGKAGDIVAVRECEDIKLRITHVWFDFLVNLIEEVWEADGLEDLSEESIRKHWDSFYGETEYKCENDPWVWVIEFEVAE